eukprot:jgi/Tetstr1/420630/TSEL_011718.t1
MRVSLLAEENSTINTLFELLNIDPIAKDSLHLTAARRGMLLMQRCMESGNEAERRVAERAVVDNMKETYVSMLAPSQLGVGISADGAARFNAEDKHLVGRPEHVWPALHAFRTPIKASVGLEVRIDKMHAYIADMEAARREAPADMEWPEVDGHHGMPVLNVPLGSPEYVHAYMRGKAEELRED